MNESYSCQTHPATAGYSLLASLRWAVYVGLVLGIFSPLAATADTDPNAKEDGPVVYRREYVLHDRVEEYLVGKGAYREIDADEFERLRTEAVTNSRQLPQRAATRIDESRYDARLDARHVLKGTALLKVGHDVTAPTLFPWGVCSLAISDAMWKHVESRPAQIGLGEGGRQVLLVPEAGQLIFKWSLQGRKESSDVTRFDLSLPRSMMGLMMLDLAENVIPQIEGGTAVVVSHESGRRHWRLQLDGRSHAVLRLVVDAKAEGASEGPVALGKYRQRVSYDVSTRGVDARIQLHLDLAGKPLSSLVAEMTPNSRIVSARLGDVDVPWAIRRMADGHSPKVEFSLPKALSGSSNVLQVETAMALPEDESWTLPTLRPRGMAWTQGKLSLNVRRPLSLVHLQLEEAEQSKLERLSGSPGGEAITVEEHSENARVLVHVKRLAVEPEVTSFLHVELGEREMIGRVIADVRATEGKLFAVVATVVAPWQIDSVESSRADDELRWVLRRTEGGRQQIVIQLAQGISSAQPLRLTFNGRWRRSPLGQTVRMDDLRMIAFPQARRQRRAVYVGASDPLELDVAGADELRQIDPAEFTLIQEDDLASSRGALLFADDEGTQALQVTLRRQTPRVATENYVSLRLEDGRQEEAYRIVCTPESTAIERLQVHISRRRKEPLIWSVGDWSVGDGRTDAIVARRWLAEETDAAGLGQEGETWELELRRPMAERFEIHARRETALAGKVPVGLVFVLQASDQLGGVTIHAGLGTAVTVDNRDLDPIPAKTVAAGDSSSIRASYRYEPIRHAQLGGEPLLVVEADSTAETALVWRAHVTSRYELSGRVAHEAAFYVENAGQTRFAVTLPPTCETRSIYVDGVPQTVVGGSQISIDLPEGRRFPIVRIRYDTVQPPLGRYRQIIPESPEIDIPVLAWEATVLTPPGYEIIAAEGASSPPTKALRLRERLLGPLANLGTVQDGDSMEPSRTQSPRFEEASGPLLLAPSLLTASRGWNVYRGRSQTPVELSLLLLHSGMLTTLAWTLFLVASTGLICMSPRGLRAWGVLLLGLGLLSLLSPPVMARIAAAVFSGALLAAIVRVMRTRGGADSVRSIVQEDSAPPSVLEGSTILRTSRVILFVVVGAAATLPTPSLADQPQGESPVYRIVIPIDENRQHVGTSYFVPQSLHADLVRRRTVRSQPDQEWMLVGSVYRGSLERVVEGIGQQLSQFTGTFDLETFSDDVTVSIPLSRDGVTLLGGATLDGRRVKVAWGVKGKRALVNVRHRGKYRLVIPLRPIVRSTDGVVEARMTIPPLPSSQLELVASAGFAAVEINGISQSSAEIGDDDLVRVSLGATDQLNISWRRERRNEREVRVDELLWLKIRPRGVALETRWKTHRGGVLPRRMRIQADRRLRLITSAKDSFVIVQQQDGIGNQRTYLIERLSHVRPLRELRLFFEVQGASGIGSLGLPELSVLDVKVDRRYAALSVDSLLAYDIENRETLTTVGKEEVTRDWDFHSSVPSVVFRLSNASRLPRIVTRSRRPVTTYESELILGFEENLVRVQFEAELNTIDGQLFQHRLQVPPGFEATVVSLVAKGDDRLYRWSQTDDGMLTLFFSKPLSGMQRLTVHGSLATESGSVLLPKFVLLDAELKERRLAIFRRNEVVVELQGEPGIRAFRGPAGSLLSLVDTGSLAFGRQVGVYDLEASTEGTLRVEANHPVVRGTQTTRLMQDQGNWRIAVDYQTEVESGTVGTLRFEIPPSMADPITITPSVMHRLVELPNTQVRQLIIYPKEAVTDTYSLQIQGPLVFAAGDRVRVPDVRVAGDVEVNRTIIVPRQVEGQRIFWEVQGLQPQASPSAELHVRVVGDTFSAAVAAVAPRRGDPQVRLANVHTTLTGDDRFFSVASFDLEPAGRKTCRLVVPDGAEIRSVRVAGLPTEFSGDRRRPIINLGSDQLPHRIEVVYQGRAHRKDQQLKLTAPALYDLGTETDPVEEEAERRIEIERSFWTISTTSGDEKRLETVLPKEQATANELARDQEHLSIISDLVADVTSELPDEVLAHWYRRWARRIDRLQHRIDSRLDGLQDGARSERVRDRMRDVEQQQTLLVDRFEDILRRSATDDRILGDQNFPPGSPHAADSSGAAFVFSVRGAPSELALRWVPQSGRPLLRRVAIAVAYALLLVFVLAVVRSERLSDIAWRWPHAIGVLAGISVWMLWFPSAVGLVLVGGSLWLAIQYPLSRQQVIAR